MSSLFKKLNLKSQSLVVINAPDSFLCEIDLLKAGLTQQVQVLQQVQDITGCDFCLLFAQSQKQLDHLSKIICAETQGDILLWFAYPKASSKRYQCDFNRDTGWDVVTNAGFLGVRQVAIDEDWSALRFRRKEFIKSITRKNNN